MPGQKQQHRNWIRSHSDDTVDVLRRGAHFAASFRGRDNIIAVIPSLPDGSLILGEVYRAIMDEISVEFPSAFCPSGTSGIEIARQLSHIHSQVHAEEPEFMGTLHPSPGFLDLTIHLYSVKIPTPNAGKLTPPEGMIAMRAYSLQELTEVIAKGGLTDTTTISCLMRHLSRSKVGDGSLPAHMREIEILGRDGRVLNSIMTNKPEWSFIQYCDANPGQAYEWRLKQIVQASSPTGDPIPVKSSLAMKKSAISEQPSPAFQRTEEQARSVESREPMGEPDVSPEKEHAAPHQDATRPARKRSIPVFTFMHEDPPAVDPRLVPTTEAEPSSRAKPERVAEAPLDPRFEPPMQDDRIQPSAGAVQASSDERQDVHEEDPDFFFIPTPQDDQDSIPVEPAQEIVPDNPPRRRLNLALPRRERNDRSRSDAYLEVPAVEPVVEQYVEEAQPYEGYVEEPQVYSVEDGFYDQDAEIYEPDTEIHAGRLGRVYEPTAPLPATRSPAEPLLTSAPRSSGPAYVPDNPAQMGVLRAMREAGQSRSAKEEDGVMSRLAGFVKKSIYREPEDEPVRPIAPRVQNYRSDDRQRDLRSPGPAFRPPPEDTWS